MILYLLYWGLLVIWPVLLWPAFRLRGFSRAWLLIVCAAGFAAFIYETAMFLWSHAAIRLDILLVSFALVCLYGSAAVVLAFAHRRRTAGLLTVVVAIVGASMSYQWILSGRESQRLQGVLEETNRLLFHAKFANQQVYERTFGPFKGAATGRPTGHWVLEGRSRYTRLIINAEGRIWLFYQCQTDAECHFGPEGSGLRQAGNQPRRWQASIKPTVGLPFDIEIAETENGNLALKVRDQNLAFTKTPPPVDGSPPPHTLRALGAFTSIECARAHAKVRHVWLWQDEVRLYGVGIFSSLVAGSRNDYVPAIVMGVAERKPDGWHFSWSEHDRAGTAVIDLAGGRATLTVDLEGRELEDAVRTPLEPGSLFTDERITLAPQTNGADWNHWFNNVMTGHFVSGHVPDC